VQVCARLRPQVKRAGGKSTATEHVLLPLHQRVALVKV
jgi:hypothetical protein